MSLGEAAAQVRVRQLTEDEAYLLGALHLQALLRDGVAVDPGPPNHVVALGTAWRQRSADLPAWVAEHGDQHAGMAICQAPMLPHVGRGLPELAALEALGDADPEAVALALVRRIVIWFGRAGYPAVEVSTEVRLPGPVLDAARADVVAGRRISLPTCP